MALAGTCYTLAVFVTYFAIGLGLNKALEHVPDAPRRILHLAMMGLLVVAAILSARDGVKCLCGRADESVLKLPGGLRSRIRHLMTRQTRRGLTVGGALALHISRDPKALAWLLLYNVCFIGPLIALFLCILFGVTSEQLSGWFQRHMAKTKFALAAVFLGLVALLALTMP